MTNPVVLVETNFGDFKIELYEEESPKTVANFLRYVTDGFYTDTLFHRVISGFMIQGGGMTAAFQNKPPTYEPVINEAANGLKNSRGTVAMARTQDPDSATCQFFVNLVDNDFLNCTPGAYMGEGYAVFGEISDGMEVVDKIASVPTDSKGFQMDVPVEDVIIKNVSLQDGQ